MYWICKPKNVPTRWQYKDIDFIPNFNLDTINISQNLKYESHITFS